MSLHFKSARHEVESQGRGDHTADGRVCVGWPLEPVVSRSTNRTAGSRPTVSCMVRRSPSASPVWVSELDRTTRMIRTRSPRVRVPPHRASRRRYDVRQTAETRRSGVRKTAEGRRSGSGISGRRRPPAAPSAVVGLPEDWPSAGALAAHLIPLDALLRSVENFGALLIAQQSRRSGPRWHSRRRPGLSLGAESPAHGR